MMTIGLVLALAVTAHAQQDQAQRILKETGVTGGLVVHVGCGDGKLTVALRANDSFIVHGLDADVTEAQANIRAAGQYGPVSAAPWSGGALPYVDNLVNLVVVAGDEKRLSREEILRVLCPGGVAVFLNPQSPIANRKLQKPWLDRCDEWTHYLRDAAGNMVGTDQEFGPPRHFQWWNGPTYTRMHDKMSSLSALVSAHGRLFYIVDEGSRALLGLDPEWSLIARDAFSGVTLWKRPIVKWQDYLTPFKMGPATLPRRLVAVGDRVCVTLGVGAPISELDAATGKTLRTFAGSENTEELLVADGVLHSAGPADKPITGPDFKNWKIKPWRVQAFELADGRRLWGIEQPVYPLSLTVDRDRVYFCDWEKLVALDRRTGREQWQSEPVATWRTNPLSWHGAVVVSHQGVLLFSAGEDPKLAGKSPWGGKNLPTSPMYALDAATGKKLWEALHPAAGHASPKDILVINDTVYLGDTAGPSGKGYFGYKLRTGELVQQYPADKDAVLISHQRCYRARATGPYILASRTGTEFVDTRTGKWIMNDWIRGACLFGILPSYNMLYVTPQPCACYLDTKLSGFSALTPAVAGTAKIKDGGSRLEQGPAYADNPQSTIRNPQLDDWPTYRCDPARSGQATGAVPAQLRPAWQTQVGGKLTALTVADGRVLVADVDAQAVCALDAATGRELWRFVAGGRVDSPPTLYQGLAVFGCRDGFIYAVRARDGVLAWRFRAGPADRRMTAFDQVESVWPVHGSVLVENDTVYAVAGRSVFLDGGLRMLLLDPVTGALKTEKIYDDQDPAVDTPVHLGERFTKSSALPDILSSYGGALHMRALRIKPDGTREFTVPDVTGRKIAGLRQLYEVQRKQPHLFSPTGFLDDSWWHRTYWTYGTFFPAGALGWPMAGRTTPSGRILVMDDRYIYGYGRKPEYYSWTGPIEYRLFRAPKDWTIEDKSDPNQQGVGIGPAKTRFMPAWELDVPLHVRAMVKAGDRLFLAGPPDPVDEGPRQFGPDSGRPIPEARVAEARAAWLGEQGGLLWVVEAATGKRVSEQKLAALPVFDGLAAAGGRLYLSTTDGQVRCYSGETK